MLNYRHIAFISLIVVFSVALFSQAHAQSLTATIDQPANNDTVTGLIEVTGTISEPLPADAQLWIVVRRNDLMWPKDPEVFVVGETWSKTVNEGGRGNFSLVLLLVGKDGQEQIRRWIDRGIATGDFPGQIRIKDSSALAHVSLERP